MSMEDDVHLVMHLRMTGNLLLTDEEPKHTRVRMELDDGQKLLFVDVRRFGTGDVLLEATPSRSTSRHGWAWSRSAPTSRPRRCASRRAGAGSP